MKILITGATGFIGSYLVKSLLQEHQLYFVVRNINKLNEFGELLLWDFNNPLPSANFPKQIDAIIHLAQARNYRDLNTDSDDMMLVNAISTLQLAKYGMEVGIKHFCYVSTGSVYRSCNSWLNETDLTEPDTMLGASKLSGEILLNPFEKYFTISKLRLFTPYGGGQSNRLIPNLIDKILKNIPISLAEDYDGSYVGTIHVKNVVETITNSVVHNWNGIYNLATENKISIREISENIGNVLHMKPNYSLQEQIEKTYFCPNTDKLAEKIDVKKFILFPQGITDTVQIFQQASM